MGKIVAVDYAWVHPTLTQLKANNVTAVGRYVGQGSPPHNITKAEAEVLSNAGIDVFIFFEYGANQALGGRAQAIRDVAVFEQDRALIGMPTSRPCYFAADFDVPDYAPSLPNDPAHALEKLGPVGQYWEYIHQQLGAQSGAYGGYWLIKRLFDAGLITWGCQTIAWSGGQWEARAQLRQTGQTLLGNEMDVDVPERSDFGQWNLKPAPTPTPAPQPGSGPFRHVTDGTQTLGEIAAARHAALMGLTELSAKHYTPADLAALSNVKAAGIPYYTVNP